MKSVKVSNKHLFNNAECLQAQVTLTAAVGLQFPAGVSNARSHDIAIFPNVERHSVTSQKALTLSSTPVKRRPMVTMCTIRCNFKELCV